MQNQSKPTEITRYKFNVHQFKKMAEVGILPRQGTEELLDGAVLDPSPLVRNRCHPDLKGGVTRFLNQLAGIPKKWTTAFTSTPPRNITSWAKPAS